MGRKADDYSGLGWSRPNLTPIAFPPAVHALFLDLIRRDDVQSVFCPFGYQAVWRALIAEQERRSRASGLPPAVALRLSGPESGLPAIGPELMGHRGNGPRAGHSGGDLYIYPKWRNFLAERAGPNGSLEAAAGGRGRHYVLIDRDFGELAAAERTMVDSLVLYKSKAPYVPWTPNHMIY